MIGAKGEMLSSFFRGARNDFVRGLLVVLPFAATFYFLWLVYRSFVRLADATFGPLLTELLGSHWWVPGIGVFLTIALVWLLGLLTRNYAGRIVHRYFERLLERVPLVNKAYALTKQVTAAFLRADVPAFRRVVLFEYPRKGVYTLGFITQDDPGKLRKAVEEGYIAIYAPTSPNPFSGWFLLIPEEEVIYPEITVEEALKLIISGGVVIPGLGAAEEAEAERRGLGWTWAWPWRWLRRGRGAPKGKVEVGVEVGVKTGVRAGTGVEPAGGEGYDKAGEDDKGGAKGRGGE